MKLAVPLLIQGIPTDSLLDSPIGSLDPQVVAWALLLLLAGGAALLARACWRSGGLSSCRRLAVLCALQAAAVALRLATWSLGGGSGPLAGAIISVVDMVLLGLLWYGLRPLSQQGRLPRGGLPLAAFTGLAALFWGLLGGRPTADLLTANWVAAAFHLGFFALLVLFLGRTILNEWRAKGDLLSGQRADLERRTTELQEGIDQLQQRSAELQECHAELERTAGRATGEAQLSLKNYLVKNYMVEYEEAARQRRRARTLEQLLAVTARITASRNVTALLDEVVNAARDILGFRMVLLRLFSPSTQAFEARAFAGIPDEGKAILSDLQITWDDYLKMTQPRFLVGRSYLIRHDVEGADEATAGGYVPDLGPREQGEWHQDDALIVPLVAADGQIRGYLSVDDPRDRKIPTLPVIHQLELLARHAASALDAVEVCDRLARNNSQLARASELLGSVSEMKSNLVANVGHELRTPLTSISAYAEVLQKGPESLSEPERREFLRVIQKESEKLSNIIDDLLALSHLGKQGIQGDRLRTDLVGLAQRLGTSVCERARPKQIDFEIDASAPEIPLLADPVLLQQLLDHLLGNAFKFTAEGGTVHLRLEDLGSLVRLVIEDNGIGIPEEKLPYIFDPFFQADASATRQHGGQGVGLSICQEIVRAHDGWIWAENRTGGGARLQVLLPRREPVVQGPDGEARLLATGDPASFSERLVRWIGEALDVQTASVMVPDEQGDHLVILGALGLPPEIVHGTRLRKGTEIAGRVWSSGRTLLVDDLTADKRLARPQNRSHYATKAFLSVPLLDGLDVIGVVNVSNHRQGRLLSENDRLLLEGLAPRITELLRRFRLFRDEAHRFAAVQESLRATAAVHRLRHDALTAVCQEIGLAVAGRVKLPPAELEQLAVAMQFYDAGLDHIPARLLMKTEPLTEKERQIVQQHVAESLTIIGPLGLSVKVRQIILHHHERYDGKGYPEGLEGEAIPVGARLLCLTDRLNALLQGRPDRARMTAAEAAAEIEREVGRQFCPRLARLFLEELRDRIPEITSLQGAGGNDHAPPPATVTPRGQETAPTVPAEVSSAPSASR